MLPEQPEACSGQSVPCGTADRPSSGGPIVGDPQCLTAVLAGPATKRVSLVPQTGQAPCRAERPLAVVTALASWISRLVRHLVQ